MPGERPGELQGCSYGCLWSWASGDPDLGSWVLTADNCVFLMPRDKSLQPRAVSWMLGACSLLWEPFLRLGTTRFIPPQQPVAPPVPGHPPTGGSSQCLLFFPQDSPEAGGEREEDQEREEEQAFLVSLYKFMKERHTPIERVPHLGFKQSASLGCRQGGGAWQGIPSR